MKRRRPAVDLNPGIGCCSFEQVSCLPFLLTNSALRQARSPSSQGRPWFQRRPHVSLQHLRAGQLRRIGHPPQQGCTQPRSSDPSTRQRTPFLAYSGSYPFSITSMQSRLALLADLLCRPSSSSRRRSARFHQIRYRVAQRGIIAHRAARVDGCFVWPGPSRQALSRCHAKSASGLGLTDFQAAVTASRHVVIAAARSTR
jgi:hypothetical protein